MPTVAAACLLGAAGLWAVLLRDAHTAATSSEHYALLGAADTERAFLLLLGLTLSAVVLAALALRHPARRAHAALLLVLSLLLSAAGFGARSWIARHAAPPAVDYPERLLAP